ERGPAIETAAIIDGAGQRPEQFVAGIEINSPDGMAAPDQCGREPAQKRRRHALEEQKTRSGAAVAVHHRPRRDAARDARPKFKKFFNNAFSAAFGTGREAVLS